MTQQFEKLTAEDLDCYRKFQQFSYSNFYIFNVRKTIKILEIYYNWLLSQKSENFNKLYYKFGLSLIWTLLKFPYFFYQ